MTTAHPASGRPGQQAIDASLARAALLHALATLLAAHPVLRLLLAPFLAFLRTPATGERRRPAGTFRPAPRLPAPPAPGAAQVARATASPWSATPARRAGARARRNARRAARPAARRPVPPGPCPPVDSPSRGPPPVFSHDAAITSAGARFRTYLLLRYHNYIPFRGICPA